MATRFVNVAGARNNVIGDAEEAPLRPAHRMASVSAASSASISSQGHGGSQGGGEENMSTLAQWRQSSFSGCEVVGYTLTLVFALLISTYATCEWKWVQLSLGVSFVVVAAWIKNMSRRLFIILLGLSAGLAMSLMMCPALLMASSSASAPVSCPTPIPTAVVTRSPTAVVTRSPTALLTTNVPTPSPTPMPTYAAANDTMNEG